jgi:hypothetical protein
MDILQIAAQDYPDLRSCTLSRITGKPEVILTDAVRLKRRGDPSQQISTNLLVK